MIILDVVLGYGAHPDPAGLLAPECESVMAEGGPQIIAYVLGTDQDPQRYSAQRDQARRSRLHRHRDCGQGLPGGRCNRDRQSRPGSGCRCE